VHGSTVAPTGPARLSVLKPDARQRLVEGSSHFLAMEHPDIVVEEIHRMADALGL
jgi:pimeloyl-ACP methyl ester carboxylesterase